MSKGLRRLSIICAVICLLLSLACFATEIVTDQNREVEIEQSKKSLNGLDFAADTFGAVDYAERNRHFLFVLMLVLGPLSISKHWWRISLFIYALSLGLILQWIRMLIRDLGWNPEYMEDSRYLLGIAFAIDWVFFAAVVASFVLSIVRLGKDPEPYSKAA